MKDKTTTTTKYCQFNNCICAHNGNITYFLQSFRFIQLKICRKEIKHQTVKRKLNHLMFVRKKRLTQNHSCLDWELSVEHLAYGYKIRIHRLLLNIISTILQPISPTKPHKLCSITELSWTKWFWPKKKISFHILKWIQPIQQWKHTFERGQMLLRVPSSIIRFRRVLIISFDAPSVQNIIPYSPGLWTARIQRFTIISNVTSNYCHLNFDVLKCYSEETLTLTTYPIHNLHSIWQML